MSKSRFLEERTGYEKGKKKKILTLVAHGLVWEWQTFCLFLELQAFAHSKGVRLRPTEAFRSMSRQSELWNERRDPDVRMAKGIAAKPGHSNHQSGLAVDIRVGVSYREYKKLGKDGARKKSKEFDFLCEFGEKFGFAQTVSSEPWHWERRVSVDRAPGYVR